MDDWESYRQGDLNVMARQLYPTWFERLSLMDNWEEILKDKGLPPVPGQVIEARWIAGQDDWWIKTPEGWYWLDKDRGWKKAPLGPP